MSEQSNVAAFEQWCILEMLGHVRLAGKVTEQNLFGCALGRIDIPNGDGFTTQFFGGGSIYRLTPTTEEIARAVAGASQTEPVHRWELPAPKAAKTACTTECPHCGLTLNDSDYEAGDCPACGAELADQFNLEHER